MRPFRAMLTLFILLMLWGGWRFDAARATYIDWVSAHERAGASHLPLLFVWASGPTWPGAASRLPLTFVWATEATWRRPAVGRRPTGDAAERLAAADIERAPADVPGAVSSEPPTAGADAYQLAQNAYRLLGRDDRRAAAQAFDAAIRTDPGHPGSAAWRAELSGLRRRWHMEAFSLLREGGDTVATGRPLFGGGQGGFRAEYTFDPLARRPVAVAGRVNIGQDWLRPDGGSAQAALGLAWRPLGTRGPTLAAERLFAVGRDARNAWTVRAAGGAARLASRRLPLDLNAYAEAGVVGLRSRDLVAGGQAAALYPVIAADKTRLAMGVGGWASWQDSTASIGRVDFGPSVALTQRVGDGAVELRTDYRLRVAGDAAPGSGPAVTLVARY